VATVPLLPAGGRTREVDPSQTDRTGEHTPRRRRSSPAAGAVHRPGHGAPSGAAGLQPLPVRRRVLAPLLLLAALLLPAGGPAAAAPAAASDVPADPWSRPVDGEVARPFDPPPDRYGAGHRGVDLAGAPGSPVRAAGDGVVVFAGMVAGRPVVSVDHAGGLRTTYEPVEPAVGAGQEVARGAVLGTLSGGHAGCPVAACLHWGLRRGEVYLDPLSLLAPPEVRLLPMG
jgi:murein DD-endopeptidase MepM/ murein hydrolase activator NlpD